MRAHLLLGLLALLWVGCSRVVAPPTGEGPRVLRLAAVEQPPRRLMVILHGYGANAENVFPLARELAAGLPETEFVAIDGLQPVAGSDGTARQWFSLHDVTEEAAPARIEAAATQVSTWIDAELHARGLPGDRLIVFGFSQGASIAHHLGLRRAPAPTVVALSGWLVASPGATAAAKPRVLVAHGEADRVVPLFRGEQAAERLRQLGADVTLKTFSGLGHHLDDRVVSEILSFLKAPADGG